MAAREIALAFGVPPLLLGLPGDNTYANYAEANRAFWRGSVLPLVNRTLGSLAHWLTPSFGEGFRLEPDLDRIEALSTERAALWQRVDAASFLSADEKRAAVGYGPAAAEPAAREEALPGADIADEAGVDEVTKLKARLYDLELRYSDSQPRDDHGRWTSGGGGGGSPVAQPASSSQRSRGVQVAFGGPAGNTISDAGGFMLPFDAQLQTAQLRDGEAHLKPQQAQFAGGGYPIDLQNEELYGNHTIEKHVAKNDQYLINRLLTEKYPSRNEYLEFSGTFTSLEAATKLVNSTVSQNPSVVESVIGGGKPIQVMEARFASPTGKEFFVTGFDDITPQQRTTFGVRVVVVRDRSAPNGFRVKTAFPIR